MEAHVAPTNIYGHLHSRPFRVFLVLDVYKPEKLVLAF